MTLPVETEICPPWKSCLECEWRVCVSSTDALVQIKFGLRLDIRSDLVVQTEFWSDLEDKTERLSSLEKFMQIRTKTEVCSKN